MKKTLYDKLCQRKRLANAWRSLSKNPRSSGLSGQTIESFSKRFDEELGILNKQLTKRTFKFAKVKGARKYKGSDYSKFRPLRIQEVRDRVVVKALTTLIFPIIEKNHCITNAASYAYQKGLGPKDAFDRIISLYNAGSKFVFEADIIKFFDTIDKDMLLNEMIFPFLLDDSLNEIIIEALNQEIGNKESFTQEEIDIFELSETGIPQGSSLSPLLSNIYLSKFDKAMLEENLGLVRYADDFVIMCKTLSEARKAYRIAKEILEDELCLKIHPLDRTNPKSKTRIVKPTQNPITFLSVVFNGKNTYPTPPKYSELEKKLHALSSNESLSIVDFLFKYRLKVEGWISAFHFTEVERYFDKLDSFINQDLYYGLKVRGWKLKDVIKNKYGKRALTMEQRISSGIRTCNEILTKIRGGNELSESEDQEFIKEIKLKEIDKGVSEVV